ncbi:hypothetical protein CK216_01170 [Mesorhizobium sp. WSM3876]|nr:hypothetical protein CK216_01170 [Mesorhizobium sp. WSM3876]
MPERASIAHHAPEAAFTIQVAIKLRGSPIVGSASYIFENRSNAGLRRSAIDPAAVPDEEAFAVATASCDPIFGPAVTRMFAELH